MIRRSVPLAFLCVAMAIAVSCSASFGQDEPAEVAPPSHDVYGTVVDVHGDTLDLRLRTGKTLIVNLREARALHRMLLLTPGRPVHVRGNPAQGRFEATAVLKSHIDPALWPVDK
jgi:hypothetical protein